jgi:general secretion pathway protein L
VSSEFWTRDVLHGSFSAAVNSFFAWYRREFFSLFSPETVAWLTDRGDRQLVLKAGESDLWCVDSRGSHSWRLPADEILGSSLENALTAHDLARKAVRIGLEMDASAFFVRSFDIPSIALPSLHKLLIADIERKTPFKLGDVVYGHTMARNRTAPDKMRITQWILRRDLVMNAATQAGLDFSDIAFIRATGVRHPDEEQLLIELEGRTERSHRFRKLALALCAASLLFAGIGVVATLWRQATLNELLDARIQEMTARAARVRQVIDKASAESRLISMLRMSRHHSPLFADLWEETARILPDSAFITDMRLSETESNEQALDLVGFANSAVGLPALFNKSPLFSDAGLTAPITPDPHEKREGFTLQAKIERKKPETSN